MITCPRCGSPPYRIGGPYRECRTCGLLLREGDPERGIPPETYAARSELLSDVPDDPADVDRWRRASARDLGLEVAALVEAMATARESMLEAAHYETRGPLTRGG